MRLYLLSIAIIPAIIVGIVSPSFAAVTTPASPVTPVTPVASAVGAPAAPVADVPVLNLPTSISTKDIPPAVSHGATPVAATPPSTPHNNNPPHPQAANNHHNSSPPPANAHPENNAPLAGALPPGMRAVSIPADMSIGLIAHMIPGDHVDVLFTRNGQGKPVTTEVLMSNTPVLAASFGRNDATANITLEADNTQVQKLFVAEKTGTVSLALRSAADKNEVDTSSLDNPVMPKVRHHAAKTRVTKTHIAETHAIAPEDGVVKIIRGTGTQESKE